MTNTFLSNSAVGFLTFILALLPTFIYKAPKKWTPLIALLFVFLINESLLSLGSSWELKLFPHLAYNWLGKLLSLLFLSGYMLLFHKTDISALRINLPRLKPEQLRTLLMIAAGLLLFKLLPNILQSDKEVVNTERFLYEATLPGLAEELAFRGVYLFLFLRHHPTAAKSPFSFTADMVFICLLFAIPHALHLNDLPAIHFDIFYFASTFISSFFYMALLRCSGSLVIPIVLHNLVNVGIAFTQWLK